MLGALCPHGRPEGGSSLWASPALVLVAFWRREVDEPVDGRSPFCLSLCLCGFRMNNWISTTTKRTTSVYLPVPLPYSSSMKGTGVRGPPQPSFSSVFRQLCFLPVPCSQHAAQMTSSVCYTVIICLFLSVLTWPVFLSTTWFGAHYQVNMLLHEVVGTSQW